MNPSAPSYEEFGRRREQLAKTLEELSDLFRRLDASARAEQLGKSRSALRSEAFRVLVVGEFKRGKSTLINALLGGNVLPAKVAPCTAVITRICYGEKPRAVLHHKDQRPSIEISLETEPDALRRYVTIPPDGAAHDEDEDNAQGEAVSRSPYSAVEVYYPLPLCRNGVEIVDSPGLNEHRTRTEVTTSFLAEADAMVFVLACDQALSESERKFIDRDLADRDLRDVFFLWNRFDVVRDSPDDLDDIQRLSRERLEPKVKGRARVFFVAARDALNGRLKSQTQLLDQSRIVAFEQALEQFLTTERARVKLRSPMRTAENAIQEGLLKLLPHRESLFQQPLEELRRKLEEERPRLEEVERQRERIVRSIDRRGDSLLREADAALRSLMSDLELGLARQAQEIPLSTWEMIAGGSKVQDKLTKPLEEWISVEVRRWNKESMQPIIAAQMRDLEAELDDQARAFYANIDAIESAFTSGLATASSGPSDTPSPLARLLGGSVGLLFGGVGTAIEGASFGLGRTFESIGVNVAIAFGLKILGFGLPVIGPAIVGVSLARTVMGARRKADELRAQVVKNLASSLRAQQPEMERTLRNDLAKMVAQMRQAVEQRMTVVVDEVRGQVQAVIREREEQEKNAERVLQELRGIREQLTGHAESIADLKASLDPT